MRKFALAAVCAAAIATPALAQDAGPVGAAPFTGPRVEGIVGYDTIDIADAGSSDGVTYGVQLGYDVQAGGAIVGIEGEVTDSTIDGRVRDFAVAGDSLRVEARRDLYVGARAGVALSPTAMVYAKGGYTNQRFGSRYDAGNTTTRYAGNSEGWRVGAGIEQQLGTRTYVKGEYRYSRYDSFTDRHQVVGGIGVRF